jgi:chromosome partitioning protein
MIIFYIGESQMKIITFASWKGGTGKTTLATSAITTLAKQGKKVLVIDLDSNLSMTTVFNKIGENQTSLDLLNGDFCTPVFTKNKDVDIIPSDLRISRMVNIHDKVLRNGLKKMFEKLSYQYDYIFIDPPGTMNALTRNAIVAADQIIIPAMPSEIDFEATGLITTEMIEMDIEADVQIILNGFDSKKNVDNIYKSFREEYPDHFYRKQISAMKSLKNLTARVNTYNLTGRAKEIIDGFVQEVIL